MARIPNSKDGTEWQVTTINYDVLIIKNPGLDNETVSIRFDGRLPLKYEEAKQKLIKQEDLNDAQRLEIMFWFGYFYGYLVKV